MLRSNRIPLAILVSAIALIGVLLTVPRRVARAQNVCDAAALTGGYALAGSGTVYDNRGNLYFLASTGRLVLDGAGTLSGKDTFSGDGYLSRRTLTGKYSLNEDCTGSLEIQTNDNVTLHADLVVLNNAKEINFIQTDDGFIFSGSLKKQNQQNQENPQ
jgi:hypothetical protein